MSDISRRDAVRRLGLVLMTTGLIDRVSAEELHQMTGAASAGGAYTPKALSSQAYKTLERLTDLIIPVEPAAAEGGTGKPGAVAAGAAAWIDMMASENEQLKGIYTKGLAWLDTAMAGRGAKDFLSATPAQQTALLDLIAYRKNQSPELAPGIEFFTWARRMTVDAFYTSAIGIKDIDYQGNTHLTSYPAPTEAITYALKRSGLA